MASINSSPRSRAASIIRWLWAWLSAKGFSHSTGLPASKNISVSCSWRDWGVATYTASTSWIGGQILIAAVGGRCPVLGGEICGPVGRARPNGIDLGVVQQLEPVGKANGDAPWSGNSPSNGHGRTLPRQGLYKAIPLLWATGGH